MQDAGLQCIRVLKLVYQHVIESLGNQTSQFRLLHQIRPVKKQIVVVEHVVFFLGGNVRAEQCRKLIRPISAPGKRALECLFDFALCIDDVGINREARRLLGKARFALGESKLIAH